MGKNLYAATGLLVMISVSLFGATGCDYLISQDAIASPKTQQAPLSKDPTIVPVATPTFTASPVGEIIDPVTAAQLEISREMSQSGVTGFTWIMGAHEASKSLAFSQETQITLYSIDPPDPPSDAIQIPDSNPGLLTSASESSTIAWKNKNEAVRVWDLRQGRELFTTPDGQSLVTSLALSNGGDLLALSTFDSAVKVWDLSDGKLVHDWQLPVWLSDLKFSPDNQLLAGVDLPNFIVYVFGVTSGTEVRNFSWTEHASPVLYGAYFSPDWSQLAWVARGSIQLMDVDSGGLGPMLNHEDFVSAVAWSPDGSLLASAAAGTINDDYAPLVYLWNPASGQQVTTLFQEEPVTSIAFSPDGRELAILSSAGTLYIWNIQK